MPVEKKDHAEVDPGQNHFSAGDDTEDGNRRTSFFPEGPLTGEASSPPNLRITGAHHCSEASRQQLLEKLWDQQRAAERRHTKRKEYEKMLISSRTPEEVEALQQDPEIQRLWERAANLTRELDDELPNVKQLLVWNTEEKLVFSAD